MSVGRVRKQGNLSSQRKGFYQEDSTSEREGGMVMDRSLLGIIIQRGSYCSVKVDETERKSCQQSLMRAEVTDVGHLQEGELRNSRSKQARAEDETCSISELLVFSG